MAEVQLLTDSSPTEQDRRRDVITKLSSFCDFDNLARMGIRIIEKEGAQGESCHEVAFPSFVYPKDILSRVISTWHTVDDPQPEDAAIYFNRRSRVVTHVGRVIGEGRVRSRWGSGGILCEHSPFDVPIYCGKEIEIVYFREPK